MTERRCNGCTLCCKLVPVAQLMKPAGKPCAFQRFGKGCTLHGSASYPSSCSLWACAWLQEPDAALPRPDHAHYVIDTFRDFIELEHADGRERIDVVQVWVDPKYPHAHRDPALRAYLAMRGERFNQAALLRYDEVSAVALFPPSMTSNGEWLEQRGGCVGPQHTPSEIHRKGAAPVRG